ncbi:MAG: hypothetical protein NTU98_14825 [Bacteroidetes bacterium]|nr:hypothetical protein [Bacteroidota bacterium]
MKKLIILFALYFCVDGLFATNVCKATSLPDLVITLTIDLHSRKSNCQSGFGICKISIGFSWQKLTGGDGVKAQAYLNSANQLVIKIQDQDLQNYQTGSFLKYFKERKTIIVDETFELSKEVSNALGSNTLLVIKQGEYPIRYDGGFYEIVIPQ